MPFDIAQVVNSGVTDMLSISAVHYIASNPFYGAIVIALIIVCVAKILLRRRDDSTEIAGRIGFWSFLGTLCIFALHYRVTYDALNDSSQQHIINTTFDTTMADSSNVIPVIPRAPILVGEIAPNK